MTNLEPKTIETKVEQALDIAKQNQKKIDKMFRWMRWQRIMFFIKALILILIFVSAWFYLPPILEKMLSMYSGSLDNLELIRTQHEGLR